MKTSRGFTLLETLVAVAVLGTAVAAVMSGISGSLRNVGRAEDYQRAVLLARAQMNELLALPSWKNGQSWRGDWNQDYRWSARAEEIPGRPAAAGDRVLMRLLLVGAWKTPRGRKTLEFETVRMQPRIQNP